MLSRRQLKPLALMAILGILAMTGTAQGGEKRHKRILMLGRDDPFLLFIPGQPLLVAAERGRSALLLHYPDLAVVRKLEGPGEQKLARVESSPSGKWLTEFFQTSRTAGTLHVLNSATGEPQLVLDDASLAFEFHPTEERLIVWQPKAGTISQWSLGGGESKRVGLSITTVKSVDHANMRLSTDGRYALIKGSCEADKKRWDACILNLEDGSTVAQTKFIYNDKYWEAARHERAMAFPADDYPEFVEALYKTKLRSTGDADEKAAPGSSFHVDAYSSCSELGKGRRFCYSSSTVTGSSNGGADWEIDVRDDLEARMITSFAASADGHWIALGIDSVSVLLFDTENLDSGAPKLVKEFEMP